MNLPAGYNLHPEHVLDLQKSGLSGETVLACQIHSVPPGDIKMKKVDSACCFPYFSIDGTPSGFERWKLFPPLAHADGSVQKYYQAKDTDPELYLPPKIPWTYIANEPSIKITVTEGEKKAAVAGEAGMYCLGIGGVWNWRNRLDKNKRIVLPTLDLFKWEGREVELIPDSDVWRKDKFDALCGFYALGQVLSKRGATVKFAQLPEQGAHKAGLDDWLKEQPGDKKQALGYLARVDLDNKVFKPVFAWWTKWVEKAKEEEELNQPDEEMIVAGFSTEYDAEFPRLGCRMSFFDVQPKAKGMTSEITVHWGKIALIESLDLQLKSSSGQLNLSRDLSKKVKTVPWKRLLERACAEIVRRSREGELIAALNQSQLVNTPFVLNPLIYQGHQTVIFAPGGSLKSYLALYLAMLMEHGYAQNGMSARKTKVLYLDWELDRQTIEGRMTCLINGHPEFKHATPLYRRCYSALSLEVGTIAREIRQRGVGCVILDSAALACGGDLLDASAPIKLQESLARLGCAALVLAHVAKGGPDGQDKSIYGSVFFRNLARNVVELTRLSEETSEVVLSQTGKNCKNSFGPPMDAIGLTVNIGLGVTKVGVFDPLTASEGAYSSQVSIRDQIQQLLSDGKSRSSPDIATALNLETKLNLVKSTLSKYQGQFWTATGSHNTKMWHGLGMLTVVPKLKAATPETINQIEHIQTKIP